jgi:eukaryotic-like serine/threonine-protein kinase
MIGETISHYQIIEKLGQGGMGVVYKAEDSKLRRTVALKLLPDELARDKQALMRFQREARAASSLNHPNICTIHEIDEFEGRHFIAMEFLEGQTLRHRLYSKRLTIAEVLDFAIHIADGLSVAHARGIVHRDIKPANIFITDRGVAKILDFGLAKLADEHPGDGATATARTAGDDPLTSPGAAVGTVAYMSPEQARGEELDQRSDLFSLGAVVYEMATGKQAFSGATSAVIFDAILRGTPANPVRLNPNLPAELERILNKALEKDRRLRYQSAGELSIDLQRLRRDYDSGRSSVSSGGQAPADAARSRTEWPGWMRWAIVFASAAVIAVFAGFWLSGRKQSTSAAVPRLGSAMKLTTALGQEDYPSWSPDGRTVAYQADQTGNWDIWVTQIGSNEATNRTADSPAHDSLPVWSPDGQWIAFFSTRDGGGYFIMPGVGGSARKIVSWPFSALDATPAQWSPDSTQLAYALGQGQTPWLEILTLSNGTSRKLILPARPRNNKVLDIRWSPDGHWLAYRRGGNFVSATAELWLTRASDGKSLQLTDGTTREWSPGWSADSRELFFLSNRRGAPDLWRYIIGPDGTPESEPQQVTAGIEMLNVVFSADGRKLAYSKGRLVRNVFRAPILRDRPATWADVKQLTFDEADFESIDVSRAGRLVLSSDRSGNWDLWTMPSSGGELQQVTRDPALDAGPRWKADGTELVFYSSRTGHREVWIMPVGGGPARQVTRDETESQYPTWSPNGADVAVNNPRTGIAVVAAGNGERRTQLSDSGTFPEFSPDGKSVLFLVGRDGATHLWLVPASGGQAEQLTSGEANIGRWSIDGKEVYFIGLGALANNIWKLSLSNREERRPVTALSGKRGQIGGPGLATDGKFLYFSWEEPLGDIWVADIIPGVDR